MAEVLVCLLAGALAGIGTGFAGLSAASFIAPLLIGFLNVPAFEAVGIALFSDVLASALSALVYKRSGHMELRPSLQLMISILVFTIIGSVLAYLLSITSSGNSILGYWSILAALGLGIQFLIRPVRKNTPAPKSLSGSKKLLILLCGLYIGAVCGFQGVGGGLMILFALTIVMGYDYKTAVGTSVFIMTFTALIGGVTHFAANGLPDIKRLMICCGSTAFFAILSAWIANKKSERFLGLSIGWILTGSAVLTLLIKVVQSFLLE